MKELLRELTKKRKWYKKPPPDEDDIRRQTDPYYAALNPIKKAESAFENVFYLPHRQWHDEMERRENNIGRYPIGFRHLENYDNYRVEFPEASLQDYCEYSNFSLFSSSC